MLLWLVLMTGVWSPAATTIPEQQAFAAASQAFRNEFWGRAERELGLFLASYPSSPNRAEAMLLQAEARTKLGNYAGAIALLESGRETAGIFADEYLFALADAQFQGGKLQAAAESYARFVAEHPTSPRVLDAIVGEASARFQLKQWARVAEPLSKADGLFQKLAAASPTAPAAVRGRFMLAEAQLARKLLLEAESALRPLLSESLPPHLAWQRDYLLAQVHFASDRTEQALALATNLTAQITNAPVLSADVNALQGRLHERRREPELAIKAWRQNLLPTVPIERQREALLHVGDVLISQRRLAEAAQTMETFLTMASESSAADLAWLTLGELRLRNYLETNAPVSTNATVAVTNLLPRALAAFDTVLNDFPNSTLHGKAQLGRGWCFWLNDRIPESAAAFRAAANALSPSYEQAVARFKLADALSRQKEFAEALTHYSAVAANTNELAEVRTNLVERALYQVVRTAREAGDSAAANNAMAALLEQFPNGFLAERSLTAMDSHAARGADPAAAREVFQAFVQDSPASPLLPEVELAIARTYAQERDWTNAFAQYEAWLERFPDNSSRPRAEYHRALASSRLGNETNALAMFTNFVARFPTNDFTPLARWWTADYYWRADDFVNAEVNYQLLFKNHPGSELRCEAQLMAGRAALARQPSKEAVSYFTNLYNDVRCPPGIQAQALFAYGDTLISLPPAETAQPEENFKTAIQIFNKVAQDNPGTAIALSAQGKVGDCYLQWGALDTNAAPASYKAASNAYQRVITASIPGQREWAQAQVGLGLALEKQAQLVNGTNGTALARSALDHYLNVIYSTDEQRDMFWVKRAGLEALRLTESLQAWRQVAGLCDTLAEHLPPLQPMLEKKKARALEQVGKVSN